MLTLGAGVTVAAAFGALSIVMGGHLVLLRQKRQRKMEFESMMQRGQERLNAASRESV